MKLYRFSQIESKDAVQDIIQAVKNHDKQMWTNTIKYMTKFYIKVKKKTGWPFNPKELSKLEVGWWKLHDELENNPDKSKLREAFSMLYSAQFGISKKKLFHAGMLKAEATKQHDMAEDPKTATRDVEKYWNEANKILIEFYSEIKNVLSEL